MIFLLLLSSALAAPLPCDGDGDGWTAATATCGGLDCPELPTVGLFVYPGRAEGPYGIAEDSNGLVDEG